MARATDAARTALLVVLAVAAMLSVFSAAPAHAQTNTYFIDTVMVKTATEVETSNKTHLDAAGFALVFSHWFDVDHLHTDEPECASETDIFAWSDVDGDGFLNGDEASAAMAALTLNKLRECDAEEEEHDHDEHDHDEHDHDHDHRAPSNTTFIDTVLAVTAEQVNNSISNTTHMDAAGFALVYEHVFHVDHMETDPVLCAPADSVFAWNDLDGDGFLSGAEASAAMSALAVSKLNECDAHDHAEASSCSNTSRTEEIWGFSILASVLISLSSLVGVALLPFHFKVGKHLILSAMVAFAIGALVGDAILHLLGHSMGETSDHLERAGVGCMALAGIFFFFILQRIITHSHGLAKTVGPRIFNKLKNRKAGNDEAAAATAGGDETADAADETPDGGNKKKQHRRNVDDSSCSSSDADGDSSDASSSVSSHGTVEKVQSSSGSTEDEEAGGGGGGVEDGDGEKQKSKNALFQKRSAGEWGKFVLVTLYQWFTWHNRKPGQWVKPSGWLNLLADIIHNFMDGIAIGVAFSQSTATGVATSLAVFLHEVPQELGDFSILLQAGFSRWQAILLNLLTAFTALIGAIIGAGVGDNTESAEKWILAFIAGTFIWIALADMAPALEHILHKCSWKLKLIHVCLQVPALLLGFSVMVMLSVIESHDKCGNFAFRGSSKAVDESGGDHAGHEH